MPQRAPQEMAAPCAGPPLLQTTSKAAPRVGASPLQTAPAIMQGAEGYYAGHATEPWRPPPKVGS